MPESRKTSLSTPNWSNRDQVCKEIIEMKEELRSHGIYDIAFFLSRQNEKLEALGPVPIRGTLNLRSINEVVVEAMRDLLQIMRKGRTLPTLKALS